MLVLFLSSSFSFFQWVAIARGFHGLRWVLRALASMALEEEHLYSFQSTLCSVVSLGVSFGLCFVICGFRRGIWICLLFGSALLSCLLVGVGVLLSCCLCRLSFVCVDLDLCSLLRCVGGWWCSVLAGWSGIIVGGWGSWRYQHLSPNLQLGVHFVTFHYSSSVVSWVCFLCCFLPFQLCPECPVVWIGRFLVFRILWFLFPLLCPRSWWLCCVWSVFCISLLPFQSLFLCTRSWLTLLLFCLVPVVLFGGGWLVVVFPLVFALSCGWCVGFLLSILLSSSLATTCILAPGVRCMLSFVSGSMVLYSSAVLDGVVGVHLGDHSVIADGFMVSFCWGSVGGQLYQLVWEVVGFKLLGGSFQGFDDVFCRFSVEYVICSDHYVHRSVQVFLTFCVVDYVLHPVGGYMFHWPSVFDVFDHSESVRVGE